MKEKCRATALLRCGVFEMDLRTGELRKSGVLIHLGPQPFKVLALLAGKPGELVTREEIQREIWGEETFVDYEQGLRVAIKKIRAALGDSSVSPRYIETLSRRGYRFIAPVEWLSPDATHAVVGKGPLFAEALLPPSAMRSVVTPPPQLRNWLFLAGGVAAVIALLLVSLNVSSLRLRLIHAGGTRDSHPSSAIRSLAVLPIENVSGDRTQEFFCAGLTDELTTDLAEVGSLRVVSRTSAMALGNRRGPLPQIARLLRVDAVVEGTAMRAGGRVRITAQLVDARQDKNLWAGTFEGPANDILGLEDGVARQISAYIAAKIAPMPHTWRTHPARSANPAARDTYWRGRYLLDRRRVRAGKSAVDDFRKAIQIDPQYAEAYAGLAQALLSKSYLQAARPNDVIRQARAAAHHALQLDPNLSEAYCALGMIQGTYDYDWQAAEESLNRSLQLNPSNSLAEIFLSGILASEGRTQEAVAHARRALRLDPLSFFANRNLASMFYLSRHYDEALSQFRRARSLEDRSPVIDNWISWIQEARRQYPEAVASNQKMLAAGGGTTAAQRARYRAAFRRGGWKAYWLAQLHDPPGRFRARAENGCIGFYVGIARMRAGLRNAALDSLGRAVSQHCVWTIWLKVDPRLDPLRSAPRFRALLRRMNLPTSGVLAVTSH